MHRIDRKNIDIGIDIGNIDQYRISIAHPEQLRVNASFECRTPKNISFLLEVVDWMCIADGGVKAATKSVSVGRQIITWQSKLIQFCQEWLVLEAMSSPLVKLQNSVVENYCESMGS